MRIVAENSDGSIEVLIPERFGLEVRLQELLEEHPELVLADLPEEDDRSIWTIGWEVSTSAGSIDLLLLDSTARIWVVEAKLASNPEIKKQVVGQVLGYASAVTTWDVDRLESVASEYITRRRESGHADIIEYLTNQLGSEESALSLLEDAAERLALGDVTALVVVDELPQELRRLVEFVNSHASFELLALKIEVLRRGGSRLFIPSVVGVTSSARKPSAPRERRHWNPESFFNELETNDPGAVSIARDVHDWAQAERDIEISWGSGAVLGSFIGYTRLAGDDWIPLFALYTNGRVAPTWRFREVHREEAYWLPMVEAFPDLSGVKQRIDKSKEFPIDSLAANDGVERFKRVVLDIVSAAKSSTND